MCPTGDPCRRGGGERERLKERIEREMERKNTLGLERLENSLRQDPLVDGKRNHGWDLELYYGDKY